MLSFALGILLARLLLPYFNTLSGKSLHIPWSAWWMAPLLLAAAVVAGRIGRPFIPPCTFLPFNPSRR